MMLALALGAHWALEQTAGEHDHAVHGTLGACVLLFVLLGVATMPAPSPHRRRTRIGERRSALRPVLAQPCTAIARTSPAWLQRFQH